MIEHMVGGEWKEYDWHKAWCVCDFTSLSCDARTLLLHTHTYIRLHLCYRIFHLMYIEVNNNYIQHTNTRSNLHASWNANLNAQQLKTSFIINRKCKIYTQSSTSIYQHLCTLHVPHVALLLGICFGCKFKMFSFQFLSFFLSFLLSLKVYVKK